jgi:superfamily II DNA helicase RecQ
MRCDFFTVPVADDTAIVAELNQLLASTRILSVDRNFVADGASSFWSICVISQSGPPRSAQGNKRAAIDYREVLNPQDFAQFARLRDLRKRLAERDGVPPYSVFTNEQLAQIVQQKAHSLTALRAIEGIGEARVTKYGSDITALLSATSVETGGSDEAQSADT